MIIPAPNDIAFSLFSFPVYKYGIVMAIAILVGLLLANKLLNTSGLTQKKDAIIDFAPIIIILGILGARLYFCMLNPHYYLSHPLEILDIREGGLSIHGGIIGGIISIILMSKKYKINFLNLIDCVACATILGQAIGRWGNYFNSEAYGIPTTSQNWGLYIPPEHRISEYSSYNLFHPTFLYESILNLIAFTLLLLIYKKLGNKYAGITFCIYLILYSLIRLFIEPMRVDSALDINNFPIAVLLSVILFVLGISGGIYIFIKHRNSCAKM